MAEARPGSMPNSSRRRMRSWYPGGLGGVEVCRDRVSGHPDPPRNKNFALQGLAGPGEGVFLGEGAEVVPQAPLEPGTVVARVPDGADECEGSLGGLDLHPPRAGWRGISFPIPELEREESGHGIYRWGGVGGEILGEVAAEGFPRLEPVQVGGPGGHGGEGGRVGYLPVQPLEFIEDALRLPSIPRIERGAPDDCEQGAVVERISGLDLPHDAAEALGGDPVGGDGLQGLNRNDGVGRPGVRHHFPKLELGLTGLANRTAREQPPVLPAVDTRLRRELGPPGWECEEEVGDEVSGAIGGGDDVPVNPAIPSSREK